MEAFHEGFNAGFRDFVFMELVNGVFVYGFFYSDNNGDEWVAFPSVVCMVLINGSYLRCLCERACWGNLSWQYVNSMNWIVWLGRETILGSKTSPCPP